jgi:hypothetical protein
MITLKENSILNRQIRIMQPGSGAGPCGTALADTTIFQATNFLPWWGSRCISMEGGTQKARNTITQETRTRHGHNARQDFIARNLMRFGPGRTHSAILSRLGLNYRQLSTHGADQGRGAA